MDLDIEITHAWTLAAKDLEIRVTAPFTLVSKDGRILIFEACVLDFGGPKGVVLGNETTSDNGIRKSKGYFASNLYSHYRRYNRELFIDTLNDWGWFGEAGASPSWYTGKPWS